MTVVARSLFTIYRPIVLWFFSIIALVTVVGNVVLARITEVEISLWLLIAGQATKWWLFVFGVLLVVTHLKLYVANGVTRRTFLLGAGICTGFAALAFTIVVPAGRGIEWLAWRAFSTPPADYPAFSAADAVREFGYLLPGALGWVVTGALVAAGFYRFPTWIGLLLIIPGALPLAVADGLLVLYPTAEMMVPRVVSYAGGLALSLAVTAAGVALLHWQLRDVPIRRTAG